MQNHIAFLPLEADGFQRNIDLYWRRSSNSGELMEKFSSIIAGVVAELMPQQA